jgi:pSer/pThr/pTyr-binding forkhead associated (FHA) protein|eukprot:CAMPEP_0198304942 /NCGR_PEP_ID=MMETSP1449-20131203/57654_1 /TAXON_ID=420275 /ORGANISM="Attheya septentrionalis, Strain CCMP2084" /LENGTH=448 /DNA_ID=CAMNT_0044007471 /DNA_START=945 /DNA_END=2291 /DNA_ORIENTATION=+
MVALRDDFAQDRLVKMTVNVSLCGAVPRSRLSLLTNLKVSTSSPCDSDAPDASTTTPSLVQGTLPLEDGHSCSHVESHVPIRRAAEALHQRTVPHETAPPTAPIEPPTWASPARGEARLEPVCETIKSHSAFDIAGRPCYRIGRSPASDIQLLHSTSSRRHALLFHHPNGSCYVVDCGSAHGTYVNGVQVKSSVYNHADKTKGAMVVPHRVRRGALIRFGGPGAPSFVLKSFSLGTEAMMKELHSVSEVPQTKSLDDDVPKSTSFRNPSEIKSEEALIMINTRLNALGASSRGAEPKARRAIANLALSCRVSIGLKRTFDEEEEEVVNMWPKRRKTTSFDNVPQTHSPCSVMSPLVPIKPSLSLPTILMPALPLTMSSSGDSDVPSYREKRRVQFSDEEPQLFYPASITPDEKSIEERSSFEDGNSLVKDGSTMTVDLSPPTPRSAAA